MQVFIILSLLSIVEDLKRNMEQKLHCSHEKLVLEFLRLADQLFQECQQHWVCVLNIRPTVLYLDQTICKVLVLAAYLEYRLEYSVQFANSRSLGRFFDKHWGKCGNPFQKPVIVTFPEEAL